VSIHLRVCPCDTERDLPYWLHFKEKLKEIFGEKVIFKTFKDYADEEKKIDEIAPEIYFASPDIALRLKEREYVSFARFSDEWDRVCLLTLKGNENRKYKKLAVAKRKFLFVGILLSSFHPENIELLFTNSHQETLEKLLKKEADIGLVYDRFFEKLSPEEKEPFKVLEVIPTLFYHYLMVKKTFYEKNKRRLRKILNIKPFIRVSKRELERLKNLYEKIDFLFKFHSNKNLLENILDHPGILIAIYRDRFIYANKGALEMTGYSLNEFLAMKPEELVHEEVRSKIKRIVRRRLRGERFPQFYTPLRIKTKDGRILYVILFSQTIIYQGRYCGLIIGVDISRERKFERFLNILREVNELIIRIDNERELFERICKNLADSFELNLVSISEINWEKRAFNPLLVSSKKEDISEDIGEKVLMVFLSVDKERGSVFKRLKRGKIIIENDIRKTKLPEEIKRDLLANDILSLSAIPLFKKEKLYGCLTLCAGLPYYFDEEIRSILTELQRALSFALDKIDILRDYQLLYNVAEQSKEWIVITDRDGKILYVSPFVCERSGYSKDEILGQTPRIFKSGFHSKEFYKTLWDTILSGKTFSTVIINRAKNGSLFKLEEAIHPVKLPDGEVRFIAIGKDVTKEEYLLEEIERFKFYDPLTELYNMPTFIFKVKEQIKENNFLSAMILLDIKGLSLINYQHGISVGDKVLKEIARRLKETLRERDIVARAGGDEIAIWVSKMQAPENINKILEKIDSAFDTSIKTDKGEIEIKYNAGVVLYPREGKTFDELYERVTLTLDLAKKEDVKFKFYNPQLEKSFEEFQKKEVLIKRALKNKLFVFYYHPYFEISNLKLKGFEALVRIREKDRIYSPLEFIDALEASPYLKEFEMWGLKELIKMIEKINLPFSINISARSFFEEDFIEGFKKIPEKYYSKIIIEITERAIIRDFKKAKEIITRLKELGGEKNKLKVALDDFGTGYSSIVEIKELPVDLIKIDRTFIADLTKGKRELSLVKTIIDLAHNFDIKVVAEGVETREQLEILDMIGCDCVQGFYFTKPIPPEELESWISQVNS